jgi:acetyltransferase
MAIRPYPSQWIKEIEIPAMGRICLRPVRPEDEPLYHDFFAAVTPQDYRLRFFGAASEHTHGFLSRLTQIDYAREMAFVAIGENGALLGVARLIADPDYTRAEFAVLIRSALKGKGLGWSLMQHLIAYAKSERLRTMYASVLADNTTMLKMSAELGFTITLDHGDPELRRVTLDLT